MRIIIYYIYVILFYISNLFSLYSLWSKVYRYFNHRKYSNILINRDLKQLRFSVKYPKDMTANILMAIYYSTY